MSESDEQAGPRRRTVRRVASTSASAGLTPPTREAGRRQLSALTAGASVALCRLQYYLHRANTYQADLEAQQPLEQLKVSSIDASFRTDIKCYLLAVQRDIRRLEGLLSAMEVASRGQFRAAQSAPALSESAAAGSQWSTAGFSTSSSELDGVHETDSRVSQRRQRGRECQTASAPQLPTLRAAGNATDSGGEREDSSSDGSVRDTLRTRPSGSTARAVEDGLVTTGCVASDNAVGGTGADDGCLACPHCGGSEGQACPPGGTGVVSQEAHPSDTEDGGEVPPSNSISAATELRTEVVKSDSKREQPTRTGEDYGEAQPYSCSSVAIEEAQATGAGCDRDMRGGASASGKSGIGTNSSYSSSRTSVKSAKSSARRVDGNLDWKGNQNKTAHGSVARPPSPHPLAPTVLAAATDSPFAARNVLRGLYQQHGLLRRLLTAHSQRLLRRTCAAALQLAAGQRLSLEQLSLQQPLSRVQLRRAVAAARAEQLQTAAVLAELQLRARCFCEAARRLRACRPRRPPRRRRCTAAPAAAIATPPPPRQQPEGAFNLEGLLALCLCWTDTTSD